MNAVLEVAGGIVAGLLIFAVLLWAFLRVDDWLEENDRL